jgi:hypothetical protein
VECLCWGGDGIRDNFSKYEDVLDLTLIKKVREGGKKEIRI